MLPPPCFALHCGAPPSGGTLSLNGVTHAGVRSHSRSETCLRFGKKKRGLCTRRSRRLLFFHPPRRDMRRKEKRLLQFAGLLIAALLFLPNVGLWSLYRDRVFDSSPDVVDGPGGIHAFQGVNRVGKDAKVGHDGVRRKDWHDHEVIRRDAARSGNGEQGKPFPLTDADRVDQAYRENGFNIYVSDRISLNRSVPDIRHQNCKQKLYSEKLPNTSIIIPFHNEGWSSLLRTVHSVLNRSPPELIAEIILVDDFSDKEHLKVALEEYMIRLPKVRILRTNKREGLIRTRLLGANAAKGEVITFLDSHCEANVNWLPPLLDRIAQNRKTIVCPMIDVIDHDNFGYETQAGDAMRGAFDWEMYYKRIPIPLELQKDDPSEPFESPVMAGGLFAVDRKWFWELGGYDTGLEIWGGEQYEISFKVWMCGGRMEDIPCSRVGHIYRKYVPYKVPGGVSLARNLKRVAEVWMDEYAEYIYQRRPEYRHLSAGDVTTQKELRNKLNCKNFKWFMNEVAWDLPKHYPPVEPPAAAWGEVRNMASGLCMESKHFVSGSPIRLENCVKGRVDVSWSHGQVFTFGWREDIRVGDPMHTKKVCFDAISHHSPVTLYDCHGMRGNQLWRYRKDKSLYHPISNSCVDSNANERRVFMNLCDPSSPSQQWQFERTNTTVLENFNRATN
ncbi:polypeptide N-acetylgalactosaminyltransferase 10-like [Girardinichthys multiradiatus]|uniref:polypeptide N-acetylgalactosaminyltransferase 10-like n=1 Tax=Girardinichthys multiradiatus TaxID=208333 RepID=UPI001FAC6B62|nr:polypeptide N-acetylgalactosaminyltransferase 10-like [Girardinichthys multiradiatus]